jgi:hypothetical protein
MNHPAILSSTGRESLKRDLVRAVDSQRRDAWLRNVKASGSILVGEDVTLADVQRWLREALSSNG